MLANHGCLRHTRLGPYTIGFGGGHTRDLRFRHVPHAKATLRLLLAGIELFGLSPTLLLLLVLLSLFEEGLLSCPVPVGVGVGGTAPYGRSDSLKEGGMAGCTPSPGMGGEGRRGPSSRFKQRSSTSGSKMQGRSGRILG
jgi:hypothetical protein